MRQANTIFYTFKKMETISDSYILQSDGGLTCEAVLALLTKYPDNFFIEHGSNLVEEVIKVPLPCLIMIFIFLMCSSKAYLWFQGYAV